VVTGEDVIIIEHVVPLSGRLGGLRLGSGEPTQLDAGRGAG
jgi:hypothetical protein